MQRSFRAATLLFASAALLAPAAVGAAAWSRVAGLHSDGVLLLGGAPSTFDQVLDHRTGHSKSKTVIGSVTDISGFDGVNWDFQGGAVSEQTLPGLQADNITQSYIARDGWWNPATDPATMTPLDSVNNQDGVRVTPAGGSPVDVWFDRASGLIARTVALTDTGKVESWIDDYRTVGDIVVAFQQVSRDPAGAITTVNTQDVQPMRSVPRSWLKRPMPVSSGRVAGGARRGIAAFTLSDKPGEILVNVGIGSGHLGLMFDSGAGNGSVNGGFASVGTISLGTAQLVDQHVVVAPLPYFFTHQGKGIGIEGLVGSEFLQSFRTTFDFDAHTIAFEPFDLPASTPADATTLPLYSDGAHAYVKAYVDGGDITVFRRFADAHGLFQGRGLAYLAIGGIGGHLGYERFRARSFSFRKIRRAWAC